MTTTPQKHRPPRPAVGLKIALLERKLTQRQVAFDTRLGEVRLSNIIRGHGVPVTVAEQRLLAKYLRRTRKQLFGDPRPARRVAALVAERGVVA
jgi:transcriptional regulator with XRE-family HTH domain